MREVNETQTNGTNQPDHRWQHIPLEFSFSNKLSENASLTPLIADAFDATEPAKLTPARKVCSDMSSAGRFLKKRSSSLHTLRPPFNLLVSQRGWRVGFPPLRLSGVPSQIDCQPIKASSPQRTRNPCRVPLQLLGLKDRPAKSYTPLDRPKPATNVAGGSIFNA